uniref:Uncharacterized protein n=1 Tax=Thalassionema nitzschioides TaxID=33649 RepID=A0A6V0YZ03_9STRA|mmetsp:Transcript_28184/g.41629  ORF Transcript_28184/g.41629 Transcript_28184/m.41629 type:complete len:203 (+) Transcript_28184:107-715(+)|eukprot:CAMPEP_0194198838 /NCGR_PEP_ID=MMETSP0156-20130528/67_1 /TAXON_ID=33649 /ORGANISM="Thalassionema nitzschioides, Strain L26-B" /LENGTH=202 /DNA_ID=CAMNT_0038923667 /DNA_START=79 /DNA_END=687 /DNA_ORIENTATION=+
MDPSCFNAKAKDVLEGKSTILASSSYRPPSNAGLDDNCLGRAQVNTAMGTAIGLFYGAVQAAWYPDSPRDVKGHITDRTSTSQLLGKVMRPTVILGGVCATYSLAECTFEGIRNEKDSWNSAYAGGVAGFVIGGLTKRFDYATACAVCTGMGMAVIDMFGLGMNYARAHYPDQPPATMRPDTYQESDELIALKEKYPKFKHL